MRKPLPSCESWSSSGTKIPDCPTRRWPVNALFLSNAEENATIWLMEARPDSGPGWSLCGTMGARFAEWRVIGCGGTRMTTPKPTDPSRFRSAQVSSSALVAGLPSGAHVEYSLSPRARILLIPASLLLVAATAVLDYQTGIHLSFGVFYLIPVAACSWWGGFPHGILLATAGTLAWCAVDIAESPDSPPAAAVWNGVARFGTLALFASLVSRLHTGILRERRLSRTDSLTGAANGRHFYEAATLASEQARRDSRPLTLAYLDLDDFKQINDRLGHAAGDEVLVVLARTVMKEVGDSGLLARLGGDEFALLLLDTSAHLATHQLARLHRQLLEEFANRRWPVGVSIGAVTFLRAGWGVDQMIQRADQLMYGAKRQGKRRVEHAVVDVVPQPSSGERRAMAWALSYRKARVRLEGVGDSEEFATVRDVTPDNIGLHLDREFRPDTVFVVELLAAGARTLLARVMAVVPEEGGFLHLCELSTRLSDDELRSWVG